MRNAMLPRLLRVAFYLLYHPFAWTYDWVAAFVSAGMWKRWVLSILSELRGPRLLELGPGPGHLLKALSERKIRATGLEFSPQMIRRAARMLAPIDDSPGICRGDARRLPFSAGVFDTVVATFPAEYIADPITWLEAARVLRTGGRFIVLIGAGIEGGGVAQRAAGWLLRLTGQVDDQGIMDWQARLQEFLADKPLQAKIFRKKVAHSTVVMLVAEKI
jgi:ubiquinone/menaquinone biosynthesis C-methylase UbiE